MTCPLRQLLLPCVAALLMVGAAGGCGRPRTDGPQSTLRRYVAAVRANQPDIAYRLLDDATRQRVSLEEFRGRWKVAPAELAKQAGLLEAALAKAQPVITARIVSNQGSTQLAFATSWKILAGIDVGSGGNTPEEAVRALLRAAENRDYMAVKRLMTRPVAEAFEAEIDKRLKKIADALKAKIVVRGNRAFLRSSNYKLELVKEDGQWRVADFD